MKFRRPLTLFRCFGIREGLGSRLLFILNKKVVRDLKTPLNNQYPWPVRLFVKDDPDSIFHARYLETQHAVIRIDRGFDLFTQNGEFRRNFFALDIDMTESPHLKECRDLPDADLNDMSQ